MRDSAYGAPNFVIIDGNVTGVLPIFTHGFITLFLLFEGGAQADISAVMSCLRSKEFSHALLITKALLKQDSKDQRLWMLQGLAHRGLGAQTEALNDFERALAIDPDYVAALKAEAQVEYTMGSPRAAATLAHILKVQPADEVSHAMRAALAYKQHDCEATVKNYAASGKLILSQPDALTEYGQCLSALHRVDDAVAAFRHVVALEPGAWDAQYNLAVAELLAKRPQDALTTLQPLMSSNPHQPEALDLASTAYEAAGNTPYAVSTLRQAIVENPRDIDLYLHFVDLCLTHKSFQVGIDIVNAGLKQSPDSAQLYMGRGILEVQLGEYESAEADFAKAARIDPKQSYTSVAQGLTQLQQNKLDEALATTRAQIEANPSDAFLYYLEAETLKQKGFEPGGITRKQAIEAAREAIRLKRDFPLAEDLLGSLYLDENRIDLAGQQFESALKHDPADESALYHMIVVSRKSGRSKAVPGLLKRFAEAKALQRRRDELASKYVLVEPKASSGTATAR